MKDARSESSRRQPHDDFALFSIFESLLEIPDFFSKKMFGGLAIYVHGKMVLVLTEGDSNSVWKGKDYHFPIWDGVLVPTDKSHHESLLKELPGTRPHPVLGKWLYLPSSTIEFEATASQICELILKRNPAIGVLPKLKAKGPSKATSKAKAKIKARAKAKANIGAKAQLKMKSKVNFETKSKLRAKTKSKPKSESNQKPRR